jgi:hypothetical protein
VVFKQCFWFHANTTTAFSSTSNSDDLRNGDCTSCAVKQDKSAYWTPPLYFKDAATGEYTLVEQVGGMLSYYFLNYAPGENKITAFPNGFEMIAGSTNLRKFDLPVPDPPKSLWAFDTKQSSQAGLAQKALGFNCLNYAIAPEGSLYRHFMPDKAYLDANCADGVRFEIMFPSCWNGKDGTSTDKKSHVAYPSLVIDGSCPSGFPVRLPGLFYEIIWNTAAFAGQAGEFVIANGDPTGYGFHGDFIMGWDHDFLQQAVDTCTNPSGKIQDCPLFTLQTDTEAATCKIQTPANIASEKLSGKIGTALPGNVKVSSGPEPADAGVSDASPAPVPTLSHSAGSSVKPGETVLPGGVFAESSKPTPAVASVEINKAIIKETPIPIPTPTPNLAPTPSPTPTPAPVNPKLPPNQQFFTTSYSTKGNQVLELVVIEELVTVTAAPVTVTQVVKRKDHQEHIHKHRHYGRGSH